MSPRTAARVLAAGRAGLGVAVLAAPERVTSGWLGGSSGDPVVRALARSLGARDLALGALALLTVDRPGLASPVQAACALVDGVDAVASARAAAALPRRGVIGTVLIAGGAALAGATLARRLRNV